MDSYTQITNKLYSNIDMYKTIYDAGNFSIQEFFKRVNIEDIKNQVEEATRNKTPLSPLINAIYDFYLSFQSKRKVNPIRFDQLRDGISDLNNIHEDLRAQNLQYSQALNNFEVDKKLDRRDETKEKFRRLAEENKQLREKCKFEEKAHIDKIRQLEKELKYKSKDLEKEVMAKEKMISIRDKKIEELTNKNKIYQSNTIKLGLNDMKMEITEKQEFQQQISAQEEEIQRLNSQVDYLRRELESIISNGVSKINQENQIPNQNIDTSDQNVKSSTNSKQQDEIKALKAEIKNLQKIILQKDEQLANVINDYNLKISEIEKKYFQFNQLYENAKSSILVKDQIIQNFAKEKEAYANQIKNQEQQILSLRNENYNMKIGFDRMKAENSYIKDEYERMKKENSVIYNEYEKEKKENAVIKGENEKLKKEIDKLKAKFNHKDNSKIALENESLYFIGQEQEKLITKLEEENSDLNKQIEELRTTSKKQLTDINNITKENKDLKAKIEEAKKFEEKAKKERINKKRQKNQTENKKSKNIEIITSDTIQNIERLEEINFGGSGKVSKVALKTIYALKEMRSNISEKDFGNFILEYELMHNFDHPNIIKAFGIFMSDKKYPPSILLEFCPSNLDEAISKHSLSKVQIVFSIYQIIEGMKYIHFNRVVHRDLKPSNILIASDGTIRVSDFGISKLMGPGEQLETFGAGTQKFMAPELLNEIEYDEKVDVYSFGVLLYYILSNGKMPEITVVKIGLGEKAEIPKTFTEFSQQLISDCWNKEPEDRPSFEQILNDLENNDFNLIDLNEEEKNEVKSMINSHKAIIPDYSQ